MEMCFIHYTKNKPGLAICPLREGEGGGLDGVQPSTTEP